MKLSKVVERVIDLGRAVREYYEVEERRRHPHYPLIYPGEPETPPPLEKQQLRDFLASLEPEMVWQLLAIMDLGRELFGIEDLPSYYEELKNQPVGPEMAISQMVEKAPLADYLEDGITELKKQKINIDKSPFPSVRKATRKG